MANRQLGETTIDYGHRKRPWTGNGKCFGLVFHRSFLAVLGKAKSLLLTMHSMPNI